MLTDKKKVFDSLKKADNEYYNTGKAIMSDADYDKLRAYAKKTWPDDGYHDTVGAVVPEHREEVKLLMHMGSQNKASTAEEFKSWYEKHDQEIIISDKLDGSSVEIVYQDGKLYRASSRGDGITGMAITKNAKLWQGLPKKVKVKGQLIIRGEVQLSVANWQKHFPETANPRNGGNGIAVCDSDYKRNEHMNFHAFDLVHPEIDFKMQSHKFKALKALGFDVVRWFRCKSLEEAEKCRSYYEKDRPGLDFEIDGMVAAIEDLEVQEKLGFSDGGTRPRGMIAYKFETEKAITKVKSIKLTIGSTGKIIPTASVEPVQLAGTTVSNCLLNNFDYIENLGLDIGSEVVIHKGGDIIPNILAVVGVQYECPECKFIGDYLEQEKHHATCNT